MEKALSYTEALGQVEWQISRAMRFMKVEYGDLIDRVDERRPPFDISTTACDFLVAT